MLNIKIILIIFKAKEFTNTSGTCTSLFVCLLRVCCLISGFPKFRLHCSKAWNNFRCKFHFRCTHFLFTQNAQCRHMKHKRASVCRSCVYGNVRISVWKFVSPLGSECVLMSFKLWRQISWGSLYLPYPSKIINE